MIRMPIPSKPTLFADATSIVNTERSEAIAFFRKPANKDKTFIFKAYKKKPIVQALNEHFSNKCAYCESSYAATAPVDVEHYRPKSEIVEDEKKIRPGYYWLACDWGNLLPSCRDCNSPRNHTFANVIVELRGKANLFPIANPKQRAKKPGQESREQRLLLHPYRDDPAKHIEYTADGVIRPKLDKAGRPSRKGRTSIRVYGLDRPLLSDARRKHAVQTQGAIEKIRGLLELLSASETSKSKAKAEKLLTTEIADLKRKLLQTEVYSAMHQHLANEFLDSL
jgi:uncharacterized protein (TIGR02646 family)